MERDHAFLPSRFGKRVAQLSGTMPATPAWPPKSLPRLFVKAALAEGARVGLDAGQAN